MEKTKPNLIEVDLDHPSLWFRPIRHLLHEGKPACATTVLLVRTGPQTRVPFGALCRTDNDRLVFWPVVSTSVPMFNDEGEPAAIDHVTLELGSGKSHLTSYDRAGAPRRPPRRGWRITNGNGVSVWFDFLVKSATLEGQPHGVERGCWAPSTDHSRRIAEFRKYAQQMVLRELPFVEGDGGNYFWFRFFVVSEGDVRVELPPEGVHWDRLPPKLIKDWADDYKIHVHPIVVDVGESRVIVATSRPQGTLEEEMLGLARVRPRRKRRCRAAAGP